MPKWNEIQTIHSKVSPSKTASKLATAQGSSLPNYGKIRLFLVPTRTREQKLTFKKPFKQTFHRTDIQHNIVGIPFTTKNIPYTFILKSKLHLEDKYTRMNNTSLTFFQRLKKHSPFFQTFILFITENT